MSKADELRKKWKDEEKELYHRINSSKEKIKSITDEALNDYGECIVPTQYGEEKATIIYKRKANYPKEMD